MSIEIQVNHAYAKPDLYVNGLIAAYPEDREVPFTFASLLVSLVGRSKTRVDGPDGEIYEQDKKFFEMSREVYPGGQGELSRGQQTPYSLHLPNDPSAPRPPEVDMVWTWNIDKPPPQVLPPSGEYGTGNVIYYEIQACMLDESRIMREIRSNTLLVKLTQTRVEEDVDHKMTTLVQKQQIMGLEESEGVMSFDVALDIPQVVVQERPFPLLLRLRSHPSTISHPLKACSLRLIENTFIACEEITSDHLTNKAILGSWTADTADSTSHTFTISDCCLDLSKILNIPTVPITCTPSFTSGNIRRSYAFVVSMEILHEGQTYSLTYDVDPLIVHAAETVSEAKAKQREELLALGNDGWD